MGFKSYLGLFGLSLAIAPAIAFIPKEPTENFSNIETISDVYDEEDYELETKEAKKDFERVVKKLDDYSFRIFLPCHVATGWILDYEIPKEGGYPIKWYVATNAHVANKFRFAKDSYEQELPNEALPENIDYSGFDDFELSTKDHSCAASKNKGYFDFNLARQSNGERLKSNHGAIRNGQMKPPKLFYVPINFLEKNESMGVKDNNYRDFAVIEVEFNKEDYARELTGEFYKNYPVNSSEVINVFAAPLNERKSWEEIKELYENYFSLGYSLRHDWFSYETNFDENDGVASLLSEITKDKPIRGHVSASKFDERNPDKMVTWNNKKLNSLGYFYALERGYMSGGSSGGLVIDKDANILGIRSLGNDVSQESFIVPLRSNKVIKDGVIVSPEYDLILGGAPSQLTSYKGQVEKHNKNTYLRKNRWKHPSSSQKNPTKSSCLINKWTSMCLQK